MWRNSSGSPRASKLDFARSITDVLPLEEAAAAVRRMVTKEGDPVRIVLRP